MNKTLVKFGVFSALLSVIACTSGNHKNDAKEINVQANLISIDSDQYIIGRGAHIYVSDSLILYKDGHSKDKIITVLDPYTSLYRGQFADFGSGPNEITVPGAVIANGPLGNVCIFDHGQLKISSYNVDSALTDSQYHPYTIGHLNNGFFPDRYVYVNDSLGFARSIKMNGSRGGYTQDICKYNLKTGELSEFTNSKRIDGLKSIFGISISDSILVEGATNVDLLRIYDFKGNLYSDIRGSEYSDHISNEKVFYRDIVLTPKYILAGYSGKDGERASFADRIKVFTHDGSFVATIIIGKDIFDMGYHLGLNRLYFIFDDADMQLAYIDLTNILE